MNWKPKNWKLFNRRARAVTLRIEPDLTADELYSALAAASGKHPLLRAIYQILDDSLSEALTDSVADGSTGEANALKRGEAKALLDFKARLVEIHADARRRAGDDRSD
jgi:hypothetical protein